MSEKVTFQELIEAISEQSENSKQFTHDFLKDFVSVINDGLEADGSVNIAGFGKFKLKRMDEREGYNPQTGEKMTIPAHNKVVFKPYKDVRELVNAPYSHLEAEIIEEDKTQQEQPPTEAEAEDEKFIPSAPPPSVESQKTEEAESSSEKKAPWEEDMESEPEIADEDDPFGIDTGHKAAPSFELEDEEQDEQTDADEDIVEFTPGSEETDDEGSINETFAGAEKDVESEEEPADHEVVDQEDFTGETKEGDARDQQTEEKEEAPFAAAEEEQQKEKEPVADIPKFKNRRPQRKESGGNMWIIAAAFIILLITVGAWYFLAIDQDSKSENMTNAKTASTGQAVQSQDNDQAETPAKASQTAASQSKSKDAATTVKKDKPAQQTDQKQKLKTVTVERGETLWGLAGKNYKNPRLWPWIYDTNQPKIKNPDLIFAGQSLDIPLRQGNNNALSGNDSLQVAIGYVETYRWYKENGLEKAKFYLYAAKKYHDKVLQHIDVKIDDADLAFANRQ